MLNSEKKILIITRLLTSGGAERVAANLASQLADRYDVWLLTFDGSNMTYESSATIIDLKLRPQKKLLNKIIWYIRVYFRVKKIKRQLKITDSISFLNEPDLINIMTKKYDRTIISIRNKRSSLSKNKLIDLKDRFVFNAADKIVALSCGVKEDLVSYYNINPDKITVIYNACNVNEISKFASEYIDNGTLAPYFNSQFGHTLITAGRLTYQKGQWYLIRAFSEVVKAVPDAKLLILGQGEYENYLKDLIEKLDLKKSVFLIGYHKNPYKYLAKADIFAFSSLFEGFGNILLEAMACKLPIISTDCKFGPRELLSSDTHLGMCTNGVSFEEYGILVPVCDGNKYTSEDTITREEKFFADAIIELCINPNRRNKYVEKSNERIKEFSVSHIINEWINILNK